MSKYKVETVKDKTTLTEIPESNPYFTIVGNDFFGPWKAGRKLRITIVKEKKDDQT